MGSCFVFPAEYYYVLSSLDITDHLMLVLENSINYVTIFRTKNI